jgi:hypothetical protein
MTRNVINEEITIATKKDIWGTKRYCTQAIAKNNNSKT